MRLLANQRALLARVVLFLMAIFGIWIHRLSSEQIENFLKAIPYRCPLRWITGWKCAFCGMTHAWIAIFRGEWLTSFHENIFGIPLFLGTLSILIVYSMNRKVSINLKPVLMGSISMLVIYAVLRNIL